MRHGCVLQNPWLINIFKFDSCHPNGGIAIAYNKHSFNIDNTHSNYHFKTLIVSVHVNNFIL